MGYLWSKSPRSLEKGPGLTKEEVADIYEELFEDEIERIHKERLSYWAPILNGCVSVSLREWDNAPPGFVRAMNAAMELKRREEDKEYNESKEENR